VILAAGRSRCRTCSAARCGIGGQVLAGSAAAFVSALLAVRYLTRYFEARTSTVRRVLRGGRRWQLGVAAGPVNP